ncbi:MucR family transcriptional regulator [Aureimonas endophytica]
MPTDTLTELTARIVTAYLRNNQLGRSQLSDLIGSVMNGLAGAQTTQAAPEVVKLVPAVPIKKSLTDDFIICLEDGRPFKSLRRHLMTHYDMSPDEYRAKWGLPADYPMVAPAYAAKRSELAKTIGLGNLRAKRYAAEASASAPKRRSPKRVADPV